MDFLGYRIIASLYFVSFIQLIVYAQSADTTNEKANITNSATSSPVSMSNTMPTQSTTSAAVSSGETTPKSSIPPKGSQQVVTAVIAKENTSALLQVCSTCSTHNTSTITKTSTASVHKPKDDSSAGRTFIKPWTHVAIALLYLILN